MADSKLCVRAQIVRSNKVFEACIKEEGPSLSFSYVASVYGWAKRKITKDDFTEFYGSFKRLSLQPGHETIYAKLSGFTLQDFPKVSGTLMVKLSQKKGWCSLKLVNQSGTPVFHMDLRLVEADKNFEQIYLYFLD